MRRGEVWWAQLRPPAGPRRPVLLLHRDGGYGVLTNVIVAEITQTVREIPSCVVLGKGDRMPKRCVVNCDKLLTLPVERLTHRITSLTTEKMFEVNQALVFTLALRFSSP